MRCLLKMMTGVFLHVLSLSSLCCEIWRISRVCFSLWCRTLVRLESRLLWPPAHSTTRSWYGMRLLNTPLHVKCWGTSMSLSYLMCFHFGIIYFFLLNSIIKTKNMTNIFFYICKILQIFFDYSVKKKYIYIYMSWTTEITKTWNTFK